MAIKLIKKEGPARPGDIQELESAAGSPLPADYKRFLEQSDGAKPEPNEAGVTRFLSIREVLRDRSSYEGCLEAKGLWPIADSEGGNYICLRRERGRWNVYFWDHELEEATRVATSFESYLADLSAADPDADLGLPPTSVWVDPDFKPEF